MLRVAEVVSVHDLLEPEHVDRLGDQVLHANLLRSLLDLGRGVSCYGYDPYFITFLLGFFDRALGALLTDIVAARPARLLSQIEDLLRGIEAVHHGHLDVHEHQSVAFSGLVLAERLLELVNGHLAVFGFVWLDLELRLYEAAEG